MRNPVGATLIAPYSLRGKPGAPLSAPLARSIDLVDSTGLGE